VASGVRRLATAIGAGVFTEEFSSPGPREGSRLGFYLIKLNYLCDILIEITYVKLTIC
jgi:hypothetical protein